MKKFPFESNSDKYQEGRNLGAAIKSLLSQNLDNQVSFMEKWKLAVKFGLFDSLIPTGKILKNGLIDTLEGLGESCEDGGFLLAIAAHCCAVAAPISRFGNKEQKELLNSMRNGKIIGAFGATEAEAGSDVMSLKTKYIKDGENYILNGEKCYITNIAEANIYLVLATKDHRLHSRGLSAFLIPSDVKGVEIKKNERRMGLHGCSIGNLILNGVVIPKSALLGSIGQGALIFQEALLWERSIIAANQVGTLRRQLKASIQHAKSRKQFNRPIGTNQYVAGRIVDNLSRYYTSRILVKQLLEKLTHETLTQAEVSLIKLFVSEAGLSSSIDTMRTFGGAGYMSDAPFGTDIQDAMGGVIYSGTSDMQKVIIAAELGLL